MGWSGGRSSYIDCLLDDTLSPHIAEYVAVGVSAIDTLLLFGIGSGDSLSTDGDDGKFGN